MADNNKLELVVEVDVNTANASIKSVNTGLSSTEQAASKAARGEAAVETPVLALFGPASDPAVWAPRGPHVRLGRWGVEQLPNSSR
jgi:hypothetical protein